MNWIGCFCAGSSVLAYKAQYLAIRFHPKSVILMASKEQKEGIARVFDTLAVSAIIGVTVGITGYSLISARDIIFLLSAIPALLILSWITRSP